MKNMEPGDVFGRAAIKAEGQPAHPDIYDNVGDFDDYWFLRQLRSYASWRGVEETKKDMCSRPKLLALLDW